MLRCALAWLVLACAGAGCTVVEEKTEQGPMKHPVPDPPSAEDARKWVYEIGVFDGESLLIPLKALISHLPHTIECVILASKDSNPARRSNAAYILGYCPKSDSAKAALLSMLSDPVKEVRYEVASSLGMFQVKAAIPVLIEGLYDKSPIVRNRCEQRLRMYTRQYFNYDPNDVKSKRDFFAGKWAEWWRENALSFEFPRLSREQ